MNCSHQNLVDLYYHGSLKKQLMGRLLLKNRQIFFEYDAAFLKTGVIESKDRTFAGLFGVFNDSLPDG